MSERTVTEVARHFAAYIDRVVYKGERFRLVRGGRPVAELTPVPVGRRLSELPSLLAAGPRLGAEAAEALDADLESARKELTEKGLRDPWAS